MKRESPKYLFLGGIREDYCITHTNRAISGALGGNAIYSAVGARIWSDSIGILGRIGSNFDRAKLERIEQGWNTDLQLRDKGIEKVSHP